MEIKEFGNKICNALQEIMGDGYQAVYQEVVKNNEVCHHGVVISRTGSNVSPVLYLDSAYREYEKGRPFGDIVYEIVNVYRHYAREVNMDMEFFTQFEQVKSRILYKLVDRNSNQKLLSDIPYMEWNDLALVFYYAFENECFGKATILIHNSHLKEWKVGIQLLYENAKTNMVRLLPEEMLPIGELLREFFEKEPPQKENTEEQRLLKEIKEELASETKENPRISIYVLSNRNRVFGAAALLYSEAMKRLADKLGKNLIILPSSVHEVLLVPDDGRNGREFFAGMVKDVNDTQVEPEERLSYNVYYYNRESERITIM